MKNANQHLKKHYRKYQIIGLVIGFLIASFQIAAQETFTATEKGEGPAIVFIPGLMSDKSVWQDFSEKFEKEHQIHLLSVAGFAGTPPTENWSINRTVEEIAEYISQNQLVDPVIVGHSLGGFIAFKLAVDYPDRVSKVISVDGLPYISPIFTRNPGTHVEDMRQQAEQMKNYYTALSPEQMAQTARSGVMLQAKDKAAHEKILTMAKNSHATTVGNAMSELMTTDLRDSLSASQVPMLLLGASGAFSTDEQHQFAQALYAQQLEKAPNATLVMNRKARHFMMWDDPNWLEAQIDEFLGDR